MRYKKFKFLEIGLGCNMAYGAGLSAKLWLEFLPNADIWMADANAECVEAKKAEIYSLGNGRVTVVVGDQGDEQTLKSWLNQAGGQFDVIIDDGGHYNNQQWQTLKHLWHLGGCWWWKTWANPKWGTFMALSMMLSLQRICSVVQQGSCKTWLVLELQ